MRRVIDVDKRGRVSLARFGFKDTQVIVGQLPDGGLTMHHVFPLTPLERGLQDVRAGRVRKAKLRSS